MNKSTLYTIILLVLFCMGLSGQPKNIKKSKVEEYVSFLNQVDHRNDATSYVLDLFERFDYVIICERNHAEYTQWDLFYNIVNHPRFRSQIGNLYTEIGSSNYNTELESIINNNELTDSLIKARLDLFYRNFNSIPLWEKRNYYDFFFKIAQANKKTKDQVNIILSDIEFDWSKMDKEAYNAFSNNKEPYRDSIMAENIIHDIETKNRKKGLIIMNYRHAFGFNSWFKNSQKANNTARFLKDRFPGRVATVYLNSLTDRFFGRVDFPLQKGLWDAAFLKADINNIGFDMNGTPFGNDYFDYFPYVKHNLTYNDAFDGFIYWKHLNEHRIVYGFPEFFNENFVEEYHRRTEIIGKSARGKKRY